MPEFTTIFSVLTKDRKMTAPELIRAVRFSIAAEYEAVQIYEQLAESTDNEIARKVLLDIVEEELVHAGEFLRLLKKLHPEEEKSYEKGYDEVDEMIKEVEKRTGSGK